ncbi:hypothetical protein IWW48_004398 [Coemansia sp. RSA 1200]|nr:hypothetical protein IWW48_004398 [Coemansia sp. RSA 1200]
MHINELPSEILQQIIRPVVSVTTSPYFTRQDSLRILSVCRQWRALTLPMAYKWIYVYYFPGHPSSYLNSDDEGEGGFFARRTLTPGSVLSADVISDLDILPKGYEKYVSELYLDMVHCTVISKGMHLMLNRLSGNKALWLKIRRIQVHMLPVSYEMQVSDQYNDELAKTKAVAKRLVNTFPNLDSFISRQYSTSRLITAFRQELVRLLSPQLNKIKAGSIVVPDNAGFSEKLTSLAIQDPIGEKLLSAPIHSKSLKVIDMYGINPMFDWSVFTDKDELAESVNFERLEYLELGMESEDVDIDIAKHGSRLANLRIHAPRLKQITFGFYPYLLSILSKITISDTVSKISLTRSGSICSNFYNVKPSTELKAVFSKYSTCCVSPEIDHIGLINDICRIPKTPEYIEIRIIKRLSFNFIENISWPAVTSLDVEPPISIENLLRLISTMPNLNRLKVHRIDFRAERFNNLDLLSMSHLDSLFTEQNSSLPPKLKHTAVRILTYAPKDMAYKMIKSYMFNSIGSLESFSIIPDTPEELSYDTYYLQGF